MFDKITHVVGEVSDALDTGTPYELFTKLVVLSAAFLAPIQNMLFSLFFLILVDLISGIWASFKEHKKISSAKLSRTISKTLVYFTTVIVVHVTTKYLLAGVEFFPIDSFAVGFMAITELKSIFENLNRISKQELFSILVQKLSNEGRKAEEDSKDKE